MSDPLREFTTIAEARLAVAHADTLSTAMANHCDKRVADMTALIVAHEANIADLQIDLEAERELHIEDLRECWAKITSHEATIAEQAKRIAELEAGLRPFIKIEEGLEDLPDDVFVWVQASLVRAAARLLALAAKDGLIGGVRE